MSAAAKPANPARRLKQSARSSGTDPVSAGELAIIDRIRARAAATPASACLRLGIGDDCAVLRPRPRHDLLVTTDLSLEGRHFRRDWHSPASIGHRCLARGLSDLAAMGATPVAAFLSLAIPKTIAQDATWLDGFLDGFLTLAALHRCPLAGGDTAESPLTAGSTEGPILADITLLGDAPRNHALRRSGALDGDLLYVTGSLGGAAAELAAIPKYPHLTSSMWHDHPHLYPQPRLATGRALLTRRLATACIDTSDGLSTDLTHLCTASGVAAELFADALPLHALAAALPPAEALHAALHGGEDYELLFTARPNTRVPRTLAGIGTTPIGRIVPLRKGQPQITLLQHGRRSALLPAGWEHLA